MDDARTIEWLKGSLRAAEGVRDRWFLMLERVVNGEPGAADEARKEIAAVRSLVKAPS